MNHDIKAYRLSLMAVAAAAMATSCSSTKVVTPHQLPQTPAAFKEVETRWVVLPGAMPQRPGEWWTVFSDPVLNQLVSRADASSTGIQMAKARLDQARALVRAARANLLPDLGVSVGASRATIAPGLGGSDGEGLTDLSAGLSASWEPDLFGKAGRAEDAARLDADSSEALVHSARLLVESDAVQSYFLLRALDAERVLVRQTVSAYQSTLDLTSRRYAAGDVAELDVVRAQTEVAQTQSQRLDLDRRRAQVEHALAVLLGEVPSTFTLAEADWNGTLPRVPAGIPSTVLARRPDIQASRSAMLAAEARVGVAQLAWFPDVALTANGGYASTDAKSLFKWAARAWGVGALLSLPVFDGGRRQAAVEDANARWDQSASQYREQVLTAFRDVEDQLSELRLLADQAEAQTRAVDSAARATVLSSARYQSGYVSQLELLDARRSELSNRRQALEVRSAQYQSTVGLIRALGGDWQMSAEQQVGLAVELQAMHPTR